MSTFTSCNLKCVKKNKTISKSVCLVNQIELASLSKKKKKGGGGGGGGFVAQRHDGVRNLLTSFLGKVCTNVEVQPQQQPLDNERFNLRSAVTSPEARLDMKAGGF